MKEPVDDTPETGAAKRREPERAPSGYYYDDGTGYEVYDPEADEAEGRDGEEDGGGRERPTA